MLNEEFGKDFFKEAKIFSLPLLIKNSRIDLIKEMSEGVN
jgi:hypothetical protein